MTGKGGWTSIPIMSKGIFRKSIMASLRWFGDARETMAELVGRKRLYSVATAFVRNRIRLHTFETHTIRYPRYISLLQSSLHVACSGESGEVLDQEVPGLSPAAYKLN